MKKRIIILGTLLGLFAVSSQMTADQKAASSQMTAAQKDASSQMTAAQKAASSQMTAAQKAASSQMTAVQKEQKDAARDISIFWKDWKLGDTDIVKIKNRTGLPLKIWWKGHYHYRNQDNAIEIQPNGHRYIRVRKSLHALNGPLFVTIDKAPLITKGKGGRDIKSYELFTIGKKYTNLYGKKIKTYFFPIKKLWTSFWTTLTLTYNKSTGQILITKTWPKPLFKTNDTISLDREKVIIKGIQERTE